MPILSIICFTIFFLIILSGLNRRADFFSPARIFGLVWSFALGLAEFKFSRLQFEWKSSGYIILLIGIITFLFGIYISYARNIGTPSFTVQQIRILIQDKGIDEKRLFNFIWIFFLLYAVCFLAEYFIEGYLPAFSSQPDKARITFGVFGIHMIVNGINTILFLIIQYFVFIKYKPIKKTFLGIVFLISLLSFSLLVQRYNFFIVSFMILCFLYYSSKYVKFKTLLIFMAIAIGFLVLIQTVRLAKYAEFYFYTFAEMKFPIKYAIFSEPYMYITMNLENFVRAVPKIENYTYGYFTLDFLLALTGMKHWLADYFSLEKFPTFIGGYNTFPFYWAYFRDFGYVGLTIIPFILGYVISEIYYKLHSSPHLIYVSMYSIGFVTLVISYSSDPLTRLDMVFNFILIVLAQFYITRKTISAKFRRNNESRIISDNI